MIGDMGNIKRIATALTDVSNPPMYNSLDASNGGNPKWREEIEDKYNHIVDALKDVKCRPESPSEGCP